MISSLWTLAENAVQLSWYIWLYAQMDLTWMSQVGLGVMML